MKTVTEKSIAVIAPVVAKVAQYPIGTPSSGRRPARHIPRAVSAEPRVNKILVPIDFSTCSRLAFRYAAQLAQRLRAAITLIYVNPQPLPDAEADAAFARKLTELAAQQIGAAFPVETIVRRGEAGAEIVEAAKALRSDLILMPTRAYIGLKHALYGSTAEHVMRHAGCPVCAIRNEVLAKGADAMLTGKRWWNIVAPVDFSGRSGRAVRFAGALARQLGGGLTLFHVVVLSDLNVLAAVRHLRLAQARHHAEAEEKLAAWAKTHVPESVPFKMMVRVGAPSMLLIERGIQLLGSDLIVMGTHEYSWMRRLLEGGGTEMMVRAAPCPVISVKSWPRNGADRCRISHGRAGQ